MVQLEISNRDCVKASSATGQGQTVQDDGELSDVLWYGGGGRHTEPEKKEKTAEETGVRKKVVRKELNVGSFIDRLKEERM